MTDAGGERFAAQGGRVLGGIGLVLVVALLVTGVVTGDVLDHPAVYAGCAFAGVLVWAAMVRPSVRVEDDRLLLRNMLETVSIPLAAIEHVTIRQFLAVAAGGRRYISAAVGRSGRQLLRGARRDEDRESSYAGFVEERLKRRVADAHDQQGIAAWSDEESALAADVRREPAWVEIVLLAATGVAFLLGLLL